MEREGLRRDPWKIHAIHSDKLHFSTRRGPGYFLQNHLSGEVEENCLIKRMKQSRHVQTGKSHSNVRNYSEEKYERDKRSEHFHNS